MSDIVDLQSREEFDHYMRQLEQNYYHKANLPKPPYESLPDYPPRPFQQKKRRSDEENKKYFIDKVNEANVKRSQAFSGAEANGANQAQQQQRFHDSLSYKTIDPN